MGELGMGLSSFGFAPADLFKLALTEICKLCIFGDYKERLVIGVRFEEV